MNGWMQFLLVKAGKTIVQELREMHDQSVLRERHSCHIKNRTLLGI